MEQADNSAAPAPEARVEQAPSGASDAGRGRQRSTRPAGAVRGGRAEGSAARRAPGLTPRQAAKAERRAAIVAAAKALFAAQGFAAVSIEQIGKGAGVSGPAVYRHFASKEAVLVELLVGISQRLDARGAQLADGAAGATDPLDDPAPEQTLRALIDFHLAFAMGEPELIRIQDRDFSALPEDDRRRVRRLQRSYVARWVGVVRAVHPELSEAEATVRVHAVFGMLNSTHYVAGRQPAEAIEGQLRGAALAALRVEQR